MDVKIKGPQQIRLLQDTDLPDGSLSAELSLDFSDRMYDYRKYHTVDGIPIDISAEHLLVDNQTQLMQALLLERTPRVFMKWVAPDSPELAQYQEILTRADRGEALILEQTRQFSSDKGAYLIMLKYVDLMYTLNPRYDYLKETQ